MTPTADLWDRLPEEMRRARQWCIAGPDKAPYSSSGGPLFHVSPVDSRHWLDFTTACKFARENNAGIGYMLSPEDGLSCIDLDIVDAEVQQAKGDPVDPSKWTTQEQLNRFWAIVQKFDSYTERSRSGKGFHIWVQGKIGAGVRRDGVEVYSQQRFIICTGNAFIDKPISPRQELLDAIAAEMRTAGGGVAADLIELDALEVDSVVWERASSANNDHKFIPLCEGRWSELGYPSQSEADLALMSMFCFYSKSNEQCIRMFRNTELGKRTKAVKNDTYLNYTLKRIRGRQAREDARAEHGEEIALGLLAQMRGGAATGTPALSNGLGGVTAAPVGNIAQLVQQMQGGALPYAAIDTPPAVTSMAQMAPLPVVDDEGLPWPPGFAGAIAGFIYQSAPRPVKEVAIVAALGLLAGICGKTFAIPQSGLNLYIILVARSGVGKEAMHSGISALMESLRVRNPSSMDFVDFSDFASGPALSKAVAANPSFVNVAGEWGRKLKRLANDERMDGPMQQLRTVMTNLYQKSGPSAIVGGITYSDKAQNISSVSGVSYSMIGETTPNTLFESLTEAMMEDGFLSRFTIIEYAGNRPPKNPNPLSEPNSALADALASICVQSRNLLSRHSRQDVGRDDPSAHLLDQFDLECDSMINGTDDEAHRQMWNRAALKVLRIAALLAVADNHLYPVMQAQHVQWAMDVVRRDISIMGRRMAEGDVGTNDTSRERKLLALAEAYCIKGVPASYGIPKGMQEQGIIPRKYFQTRASRQAAFNNHRMGSANALDATLRSLCDSGYLIECDKNKTMEAFGYSGKAYRLISKDMTNK